MNEKRLYGIQQIGIGVENLGEAVSWYRKHLGARVKAFEDHEVATHMAPYMSGKPAKKSAIMLLNPAGGGGFELWQYTDRKPKVPDQELHLGDPGINYIKLESNNLKQVKKQFSTEIISEGINWIVIRDPFGNAIMISENRECGAYLTGVKGVGIGVSDMEAAVAFYQEVLGFSQTDTDASPMINCGDYKVHAVSLEHTRSSSGRLGTFFGQPNIDLIKSPDRPATKTYEKRNWGDPGLMHICFDVYNLPGWVNDGVQNNAPFTVLSNPDFQMGDAQGHWGYFEDPDGTLIEMVETHKIPIIAGLGWFIDLRKMSPDRPLSRLFIKVFCFLKSL